jgi:hypothetical protein
MCKLKIGDHIIFGDRRSNIGSTRLTVGSTYVVLDYDHNNTSWPDGCRGEPFVTVTDNFGGELTILANRFDTKSTY